MMKFSYKYKWLWIGLGIIIGLAVVFVAIRGEEDTWIKDKNGNWVKHGNPAIQNFESCAKKYPVMETYPEQCRIPNGPTFTKEY
jgi:hypothetical protein